MPLSFLPTLPLPASPLVLFGVLLIAGHIGGELVYRITSLPRITGYVLVGMLLGASGLKLLTPELMGIANVFVDIALGLVLFELGRRLDFKWLRHDPWLLVTGLVESALSFGFVFFALAYFGVDPVYAAAAAAIGVATSPAIVLLVARELGAEGQITERTLALTAINSVISFVMVTMMLSWIHSQYRANWYTVFLHPVYLLLGSVALGFVANHIAKVLARWLRKHERHHFMLLLGLIIITVGCATVFKLSVVLALLAFGVMVRNLDERHDLMVVDMSQVEELFFVVLFVVGGANLHVADLVAGSMLAVVFIVARFIGKSLGVLTLTWFSGVRRRHAALLCMGLVPMSGFAVTMMQSAMAEHPEFGSKLGSVVLAAVVVLELVGPLMIQLALRRAKESGVELPDGR